MGCAKMLRIIDALTGVFASSAEAPGAHAPSVRRVPARSVAPPRTRAIRVEIPTCDASSVLDDEGMEREALELVAAVEEGELDQERHADDVAPELLDQPERRGHRAARGEQVIDGEYALRRLDRVLVDGERVAPVLELVLDLDGLARELAELPHGDETRAQLVGERPTEDEPARLDGDHDVHALLLIAAREHVDHVVERRTVLEKGGDVLEEDPLGWEVPDVTDLRPEVGDVHRAPILRAPCRSAQDAARQRRRARVTPNGRPSVRSPTSVRRAPPLNPRISSRRCHVVVCLALNLLRSRVTQVSTPDTHPATAASPPA